MSAADAPSRKRSRPAGSADPDTSRDIKKSEDFWFQDGSVVLQAERERFRVHRTILERHSSVFRDMFSFPQPQPLPDDADVVDGCPLIHLSDSASDVAVVLGILYDGSRKTLNPKAKRVISISRVAAMARLGRKYDIPFMQNAALSYLELDFPATLSEWDAHHHRPEHILGVGCKSYVLNLSYELGWTKLMPAAFVHHLAHTLLYYGRDHIIFNTTPVPLAPAHFHQQILLARERLILWLNERKLSDITRYFGPQSTWTCCDTYGEERLKLFNNFECWIHRGRSATLLIPWDDDSDSDDKGLNANHLCPTCEDEMKDILNSIREDVWRLLPSFLDLDSWED